MFKFIAKLLIVWPLQVAWFLFKVVATIFLLFLGPFGWAFIAAWWFTGNAIDNNERLKNIEKQLQSSRK